MKMIMMALSVLLLSSCDDNAVQGQKAKMLGGPNHLVIIDRSARRHDFKIELALTPQQQAKGLMKRTEMAKDAGMLFYFGKEDERSFWMKDTLIPLDMIFIKADGTISKVHESASPQDLTSVKSDGPAIAVLELKGGTSKKYGIIAGDKVHHVFFGNEMR
jgi:uncharacterized membrane protein (UPF0127 family)